MLRVAAVVPDTSAEGPGRRWALWVQGCSIRCAGCCNPEMFDERRGRQVERGALVAEITDARRRGVEGVTFLGGEPFDEPIVMWWNFVARSNEEIVHARRQWQDGTRFGQVLGAGDRLAAPPLPAGALKARGATR